MTVQLARHRIVYCGHVEAYERDRAELQGLGVYGPMRFVRTCDDGRGVFKRCYVSKATLSLLRDAFGVKLPGSFIAIDAITYQVVPSMYQLEGTRYTQQDLERFQGYP